MRCVEEGHVMNIQGRTSAFSRKQKKPLPNKFTSLTIFKTSGIPSPDFDNNDLGEMVATLTPEQPHLQSVANGIKVKGQLNTIRSYLALELFKKKDCLAGFVCQLQTVDSGGAETFTSARVYQDQTRRVQVDGPVLTSHVAIHILDLVHQLDAKITGNGEIVKKLESKMNTLKSDFNSEIKRVSEKLENKMQNFENRVEDKIAFAEKDLRDSLAYLQTQMAETFENKLNGLVLKAALFTNTGQVGFMPHVNSLDDANLMVLTEYLKVQQQEALGNLSVVSHNLVERQCNETDHLLFDIQRQTNSHSEFLGNLTKSIDAVTDINTELIDQFASLQQNFVTSFNSLAEIVRNSSKERNQSAQNDTLQINQTLESVIIRLLSPTRCYRGLVTVVSHPAYPYPVVRPSPDSIPTVSHLCDTTTDGGGWIVIQRRSSARVNFYRGWTAYKHGFGELDKNFWLGNEHIHQITTSGLADVWELRIELIYEGKLTVVRYGTFSLDDEENGYRLTVGDFSGNTRDSLTRHSGKQFTTFDRDNDNDSGNCAALRSGAWWYDSCADSNLNGKWGAKNYQGPQWSGLSWGNPVSFCEMKIRRLATT
ncbi:fibrinogen-related protein 3.1 [Elysia marginata]|uniref:Fibrinogen-related protein 3.1 n=1 Tax=Elysia marginata TaxID=1093978 RepID=A0AAV4EMT8_9GAST|nr:fibrinogen-related protein 3.1 [Elysia marginata]